MGPHLPAWSSSSGLAAGTASTDSTAARLQIRDGGRVSDLALSRQRARGLHGAQRLALAGNGPDALARVHPDPGRHRTVPDHRSTFVDARRHVAADDGALVWLSLSGTARHVLSSPAPKDKVDDENRPGTHGISIRHGPSDPRPGGLSIRAVFSRWIRPRRPRSPKRCSRLHRRTRHWRSTSRPAGATTAPPTSIGSGTWASKPSS